MYKNIQKYINTNMKIYKYIEIHVEKYLCDNIRAYKTESIKMCKMCKKCI